MLRVMDPHAEAGINKDPKVFQTLSKRHKAKTQTGELRKSQGKNFESKKHREKAGTELWTFTQRLSTELRKRNN